MNHNDIFEQTKQKTEADYLIKLKLDDSQRQIDYWKDLAESRWQLILKLTKSAK